MKKNTVWISIILFLFLLFGGMLWGLLKADRPRLPRSFFPAAQAGGFRMQI